MRRLILIALYLALLVASTLVRDRRGPVTPPAPGQKTIAVPEHANGQRTGRDISLAYWDEPASTAGADALSIPIVLLHGSPMPTPALRPLMRELRGHARVIAPDFPGFGGSTRVVADYSFDAHARAVFDLLDRLGIDRAHVVAYSMGGGVALGMESMAPRRIASLSMLAGLGVQELELLGDHRLNHAIHGLQFAGIWALQELTPHFGVLDRFLLNTSYARNFLDSDQRPLRGLLESYRGPMLIVHGDGDSMVPTAAGREHARIVPQSRFALVTGGHLAPIETPRAFSPPLLGFLHDVEAGRATTRANADPERVRAAAAPFDWRTHGMRGPGYPTHAAVLLALATLVSEDLACLTGGLLVARGALGFLAATTGCLGGIFFGDVLLFLAGRVLGVRALAHRPLKWFLKPARVDRCTALFKRRGAVLVLIARFMPGLRLPTYFAAGLTRMKLRVFLLYFFAAALLWTPLLVAAAALVGDPIFMWADAAGRWGWLAFVLGLAVIWIGTRAVALAITARGRRLLLGWWRRRTRWEFWPAWLVYPPVALNILWLGVRHRGFTVFTAANPAIPCGGLAGESKSEILRAFPEDTPEIARFAVIPVMQDRAGARLKMLDAFMETRHLAFPIVLKPDIGERGQGVAVIRDRAAGADYLERCGETVIAQEFIDGREFGLFYARRPGEARGRIISITAKHLTTVRGDGTSTLEELILADDRAVCMAPFFLAKLALRLGEVPAADEAVQLTELGTHCRGARFTDGWDEVWSERLEQKLDALSRGFTGFFFGRYDVRTPAAEAMRERGEFRVLEVNGVGSETTHIYDPRNSLWRGWTSLIAQWRLAFQIGADNRARGVRPASIREVIAAVTTHLGREKFEA